MTFLSMIQNSLSAVSIYQAQDGGKERRLPLQGYNHTHYFHLHLINKLIKTCRMTLLAKVPCEKLKLYNGSRRKNQKYEATNHQMHSITRTKMGPATHQCGSIFPYLMITVCHAFHFHQIAKVHRLLKRSLVLILVPETKRLGCRRVPQSYHSTDSVLAVGI